MQDIEKALKDSYIKGQQTMFDKIIGYLNYKSEIENENLSALIKELIKLNEHK